MKDQFDVWRYKFAEQGEHSVVLISHPDLCARATRVNVLYCTSQRQSRPPKPNEVLLDRADGFDWSTFVECELMYSVPSDKLYGKRGHVGHERRQAIRAKIRDLFRLLATD